MSAGPSKADFAGAVDRARRESPFLAELMRREPALLDQIAAGVAPSAFDGGASEPVARRLRVARRRVALTAALRDLAGAWGLGEVTAALTAFADWALDLAIRTAVEERTPGAAAHGFAAIALGKQGGGELNYSSDIDPILLFDPQTFPRRARDEPEAAAVRVGRRVVDLLQARDADGYVLRVDLRLRPSPEVTPIVLPVNGAIGHYESQALAWERAAFIRARAAAGDLTLGRRFLDAVRPFVWRRGLDFGAVDEVLALSQRIRGHYAGGQRFGPGYDLKRGRGGIREVEFFAQAHQLIHGGRDPSLRVSDTRDALAALARAGWLDAADAAALSDAYTLLRTVEHRLQMVDDRQTHTLPSGEALDRVARLHGVADGRALLAILAPHVAAVERLYDRLEPRRAKGLPREPAALDQVLARAGWAQSERARARIAAWRGGAYPALRSAAAQGALEAVLPRLAAALAGAPDPDAALVRLDRVLERLPSAVNILRLLDARPGLVELLAAVLSHAPTLADELARRPVLMDGLVDASALEPAGSVAALSAAMARPEPDADFQARLARVAQVVGETRFALGVQLVAGRADPLAVGEGYARTAEAAITTLAGAVTAEFARAHGVVPDGELVVLALGRMGGGLLTHASDLDLICLFTGDFGATSDGPRPLGATLYFNRLAQRLTGALSTPTASGPLYPVDTRLRPQGAKGPLAVSLDSFARYQREEAWTWEHMALTRARVVHGSPQARAAVEAVIGAVLAGGRATRDVAADARAMRADLARHKPPAGPLDVKLSPGGLVDLEFAAHVVQLRERAGFDPHLGRAVAALAAAGLLPSWAGAAHDLLTRMLVMARLVAPDAAAPGPAARALIADALGLGDWDGAVAALDATRQEVSRLWAEVGG